MKLCFDVGGLKLRIIRITVNKDLPKTGVNNKFYKVIKVHLTVKNLSYLLQTAIKDWHDEILVLETRYALKTKYRPTIIQSQISIRFTFFIYNN